MYFPLLDDLLKYNQNVNIINQRRVIHSLGSNILTVQYKRIRCGESATQAFTTTNAHIHLALSPLLSTYKLKRDMDI